MGATHVTPFITMVGAHLVESADPSARGSAPGSYDAKCVLTEPATCGLHGLGTKPAGVRGPPKVLEAHSAPNAFRRQYFGIVRGRWFAWFGHESCCCSAVSQAVRQRLWTQRFWKLIQRHCSPNAFRRQHFGIVRGRCFAWFRHESCCCSAVAQAVRQRLRTLVFDVWHFIAVRHRFWKLILRLMRFVGNVSALFVVAVSHGFCDVWHFIAAR